MEVSVEERLATLEESQRGLNSYVVALTRFVGTVEAAAEELPADSRAKVDQAIHELKEATRQVAQEEAAA